MFDRKEKRLRKNMLFLLLACLLGLACLMAGCSGTRKANASQFAQAAFSGLDGEGTLTLSFDTEALITLIREKKQLTERELEELRGLLKDPEKDFILSKKTGLSNGDTVEVTGGFDKSFLKKFGIVLENDTASFTVEGLVEPVEIRLNDYLRLDVEGFDGEAQGYLLLDRSGLLQAAAEQKAKLTGTSTGEDEELLSCVEGITLDETYFTGLASGDVVHAAFTVERPALPQYGITFVWDEVEETVSAAPTETLALSDYYGADFTGYEGMGRAAVTLDKETLEADLTERFAEDGRGAYGFLAEEEDAASAAKTVAAYLENYLGRWFSVRLDADRSLSNGDRLHLTGRYSYAGEEDKTRVSSVGILLLDCDKEVEVSGLKPATEISLNDYLDITFTGFDGSARAEITLDRDTAAARAEEIKRAENEALAGAEEIDNSDVYRCLSSLAITPSLLDGLQDGDEIHADLELSNDRLEAYGIVFTCAPVAETAVAVPVEEISLADYFSIKASGYDTLGTAEIVFDEAALAADLAERFAADGRGAYGFLAEGADADEEAREAAAGIARLVEGSAYNTSVSEGIGLHNGQSISIYSKALHPQAQGETAKDGSSYLPEVGIWLKDCSKRVKVEGLRDTHSIFLNDYVSFTFDGFDGYATGSLTLDREAIVAAVEEIKREETPELVDAAIDNSDVYRCLDSVWFSEDHWENLSEGETVEAELSMGNALIEGYGIFFTWDKAEAEAVTVPVIRMSLSDYMDLHFHGYDGAGTADVTVDTGLMKADLEERFTALGRGSGGFLTGRNTPSAEARKTALSILDYLDGNYRYAVNGSEGLSNGMSVTATVTANNTEAREVYLPAFGILLVNGRKQQAVEGLKETTPIDLVEALTARVEGIVPDVTVTIELDEALPFVHPTDYEGILGEHRIHAYNGEAYSGTIPYEETAYLQEGYRVENADYRFAIEGLPTHLLSVEAADAPALALLVTAGEEHARDIRDYGWQERVLLERAGGTIIWNDTHTAYEGMVLAQQQGEWADANSLYLIYHQVTPVRTADGGVYTGDFYFASVADNVVEDAAGRLSLPGEWRGYAYADREEMEEAIAADIAYRFGEDVQRRESGIDTAEALTIRTAAAKGQEAEEGVRHTQAVPDTGLVSASAHEPVVLGGHVYYLFDTVDGAWLTFSQAQAYCVRSGGHLATIADDKEYEAIRYLLNAGDAQEAWIGGHEGEYEGNYSWLTGEDFAWQNWADGQPDNAGEDGESALVLWRSGDAWLMHDENEKAEGVSFILETDGEEQEQAGIWLADLHPVNSAGEEEYAAVKDPYGDVYFRSLGFAAGERALAEYALDGAYESLSATVGTWAEAASDTHFNLAIWGDGRLLYSRYDLTKADAPKSITIPLAGVSRLSVQTGCFGSWEDAALFLHDARLLPADAAGEAAKLPLSALPVIDSRSVADRSGMGLNLDANGLPAANRMDFAAHEEGRLVLRLNGLAEELTADLANMSLPWEGAFASVSFYADGEEIWHREQIGAMDGIEAIDISLTGVQVLDIRTGAPEEAGEQVLSLTNAFVRLASAGDAAEESTAAFATVEPGKLTIACSPDYWPYEYFVEEEGERVFAGADAAFCAYLAERLGLELSMRFLPFEEVLSAMQEQSVDLAVSALTANEERAAYMDFSEPYGSGGLYVGVRKGKAGLLEAVNAAIAAAKEDGSFTAFLNEAMAVPETDAILELPE